MNERILTESQIVAFSVFLKREEKSENTVEKYLRDVKTFAAYTGDSKITKETVIAYNSNSGCFCYNIISFLLQSNC